MAKAEQKGEVGQRERKQNREAEQRPEAERSCLGLLAVSAATEKATPDSFPLFASLPCGLIFIPDLCPVLISAG